jgi:sulfur-oxidizing protein SoxX
MNNRTGPRPKRVCGPIWLGLALMLTFGSGVACAQTPATLQAFKVVGDGIPESLSGLPGDPARGRKLVASRQPGLCLLCHSGPFFEEPFQGNLAPDLTGSGARWSVAQLRLRLVDSRRVHPDSIMPAYYRTEGLTNVAAAWQGQPILSAQQIEDVVAFLATLK